jgi:hypothetical protein
MADTKPQRRRLTTRQQLTQRPVTAPRHPSTTPLRHWSIIPQLKLQRATTPKCYSAPSYYTEVLLCPELLHRSVTLPRATTPKCYSAPSYYTEVFFCPGLLHPQGTGVLHDYVYLPILLQRWLSTTLFPATTPRLQLITPSKTVEYYTDAPKYYSAPISTTTTEAAKYYAVPTYYTEAAPSYYVDQKYHTDAPVCYTTTYAKSS